VVGVFLDPFLIFLLGCRLWYGLEGFIRFSEGFSPQHAEAVGGMVFYDALIRDDWALDDGFVGKNRLAYFPYSPYLFPVHPSFFFQRYFPLL
jgi:hypothetical protein